MRAIVVTFVLVLLAGCSSAQGSTGTVPASPPLVVAPAPRDVKANELGVVPVLMYHGIVEYPTSVYERTPAEFRAELERLAREGYVPVRARDLATGALDVPAGRHPVVLTFDDGLQSQLTLDARDRPLPTCAVGILLDVAKAHPGFTPTATFFINAHPFADRTGKALSWLTDNGFEVGNHTLAHTDLRKAKPREAERAIARLTGWFGEQHPGVPMETLALPFGSLPRDEDLAVSGSADGVDYRHAGVFLVGAEPASSPHSKDFDPARIPRIRSQGAVGNEARFASTAWLDKLAAGSPQRYTSDGNPRRISFPRDLEGLLAPSARQHAQPY
ncbi:polysaccharide deacetylase family protein [Allokutzneria albata]|nr:polysaccharide deacetylase family protein [Allokutzneria albata]